MTNLRCGEAISSFEIGHSFVIGYFVIRHFQADFNGHASRVVCGHLSSAANLDAPGTCALSGTYRKGGISGAAGSIHSVGATDIRAEVVRSEW